LSTGTALAQAPIKIGFMAELSVPQGALGQDQYDAFMMVVERNGGKLGGVPVTVLREDSQLKPEVATQIVDKLIEKDGVPIITGTFSNVRGGPQDHGEECRSAQCGLRRCRRAVLPYGFIVSWQNDNQAEVVASTRRQGLQRDGMAPNYQAGKDFIAGFKRLQGEIIDEITASISRTSPPVSRSRRTDAVYVFIWRPRRGFVRQYKQAGLLGKIPLSSRRRRPTPAQGRRVGRDPGRSGARSTTRQQVRRRIRENTTASGRSTRQS
jgi:branched-chain amino acid transport system substrate-binding protein